MQRREFLQSALLAAPIHYLGVVHGGIRYRCSGDRIEVVRGAATIQTLASPRPVSVTVDPSRRYLVVVNGVKEYRALPTGAIESYAIEPSSGRLCRLSRQALGLACTEPRHCAISPDGRYVVVTVFGGGAYNVLQMAESGELGRIHQVVKVIGSGADVVHQATAHPHSVVFHPAGRLVIGTDLGSDRIDVFRFERSTLTLVHRYQLRSGSGPGPMSIDRTGTHVCVTHILRPGATHYRLDEVSGRLTDA